MRTIFSFHVAPWGIGGKRFGPDLLACPVIDIETQELITEICARAHNVDPVTCSIERDSDGIARVYCNKQTFAYAVYKHGSDKTTEVRGDEATWLIWQSIQ